MIIRIPQQGGVGEHGGTIPLLPVAAVVGEVDQFDAGGKGEGERSPPSGADQRPGQCKAEPGGSKITDQDNVLGAKGTKESSAPARGAAGWPGRAISGDQKLARRLSRAYHVDKPHRIAFTTARYVVLRHLLAGDDAAALEVAERVKPGYLSAFPPPLIEFPLGVVRNDPKLLLKGVKALSTRFKGRWNQRKLQRKGDQLMSAPAMKC